MDPPIGAAPWRLDALMLVAVLVSEKIMDTAAIGWNLLISHECGRCEVVGAVCFQEAILSYNSRRWNFSALHRCFNEDMEADEAKFVLDNLLPAIARLALRLPQLCTQASPFLALQSI